MRQKNDYHLLFGPADQRGELEISSDELLARTAQEADLFPMDYLAFPGGWTGGLDVDVLDLAGIERFRKAAAVWRERSYLPNADPDLEAYEQRLRSVRCRQLRAEVV